MNWQVQIDKLQALYWKKWHIATEIGFHMIQLWVSAPGFLCYCLDKDLKMSTFGLEDLDKTGESCTTPGGAEKVGRRCFESRQLWHTLGETRISGSGNQDRHRWNDHIFTIVRSRFGNTNFVLMYAIMKYWDRMWSIDMWLFDSYNSNFIGFKPFYKGESNCWRWWKSEIFGTRTSWESCLKAVKYQK